MRATRRAPLVVTSRLSVRTFLAAVSRMLMLRLFSGSVLLLVPQGYFLACKLLLRDGGALVDGEELPVRLPHFSLGSVAEGKQPSENQRCRHEPRKTAIPHPRCLGHRNFA